MNKTHTRIPTFKLLSLSISILLSLSSFVQAQQITDREPNFWDRVQFGGALGLGFGNGYFNGTIAPSALYRFNRYAAVGTAVNFSYVSEKNFYKSYVAGMSLMGIFSPIPEIQLSVEPQQSYVSRNYDSRTGFADENFWVTALFLGAGFNTGNVTVGIQYDVLYDASRSIYADAWFPFVRVWF